MAVPTVLQTEESKGGGDSFLPALIGGLVGAVVLLAIIIGRWGAAPRPPPRCTNPNS